MTRQQFIDRVECTQSAFRRFLCALCCGDTQLAEDIAQESYVKAWLSCEGLSDLSRFKAWIFRIGYNTFLNNRREARHTDGYDAARDVRASETADASFRYEALYNALESLPDKERMSVLLFYMEGYSVKEIASIVEASPDAVRQHLSRGRNRLRGLLNTDN